MSVIMIDPEKVEDNPYQPRSHYPRKTIDEIAYSIEQIGIIHIPTGRQVDGHYELAEGHLRKRAYIKLKKKNPKKFGEMPLDIRKISDRDMAIISLEENLRRQDITPLEQARAVDMYLSNFTDVTEVSLAKTLNMTQGNVSNMRRVLKCPDEVLQKIVDGKINFTMARELLVFQGLNAGFENDYRGGKEVKVPKDEKWLMLKAVRGVSGQYGRAATVDGIKRCIYDVAESNLKWVDKQQAWQGHKLNPLFDTRAAGCLKCPKMIRAFETKTKAKHFCTDFECWDEKQEAHKKKQETKAKKMMEADIAQRIAETEAHNAVVEKVTGKTPAVPEKPEETTVGIPILDTAEEVLKEQGTISQEITPTFTTWEEVCKGCIQQKGCERKALNIVHRDEGDRYVCTDRVTKENYQEVREKAKVDMPDSFKAVVSEQAGTRAIVLDLRELRLGSYRDELKAGHAMLDGYFYEQSSGYGGPRRQLLDVIENPEECTERCTEGFHYAYDSDKLDEEVHFVCSKPWKRPRPSTSHAFS
ncbi:Nucleoid occlusion protein [subsurface metagenome]